MIRYVFNKMLLAMQRRYDYDVGYQQDILRTDLAAFLKFMGFQTMWSHSGALPAEVLFAARIRAIIWDDCGPCTQLIVNMALEANVSPDVVTAIVDRDLEKLSEKTASVVRFTELVLAHDPEADELRNEISVAWGMDGLVTIGLAISSCRVYPALKYSLGYGKACRRIQVGKSSLAPNRVSVFAGGGDGA